MGSLTEKLTSVQAELKAPKGQYNSFGKYKYRSCEDILEAVKPLLAKNGLSLVISDEIVNIGDRFYVKATARLTDGETTIEGSAFAREEESKKGQDGSQVTGTASSYARKYCLNGLFLIDDTKDADTDEYTNQRKTAEDKERKNLNEEKKKLDNRCKGLGQSPTEILHTAGWTPGMPFDADMVAKCNVVLDEIEEAQNEARQ